MRIEITLPEIGDDSEDTANVSSWLVKIGDVVNEGDDLVELTTDKAAFTVPSPHSGKVVEILAEEGVDVAVGDVLCILDA